MADLNRTSGVSRSDLSGGTESGRTAPVRSSALASGGQDWPGLGEWGCLNEWLVLENAAYAPSAITEGLDGVIWGVVTRVLHAV